MEIVKVTKVKNGLKLELNEYKGAKLGSLFVTNKELIEKISESDLEDHEFVFVKKGEAPTPRIRISYNSWDAKVERRKKALAKQMTKLKNMHFELFRDFI